MAKSPQLAQDAELGIAEYWLRGTLALNFENSTVLTTKPVEMSLEMSVRKKGDWPAIPDTISHKIDRRTFFAHGNRLLIDSPVRTQACALLNSPFLPRNLLLPMMPHRKLTLSS